MGQIPYRAGREALGTSGIGLQWLQNGPQWLRNGLQSSRIGLQRSRAGPQSTDTQLQ